jgi:hypothetical protein
MSFSILSKKQIPSSTVFNDQLNVFTVTPQIPLIPTLDAEAASKKYVDEKIIVASTGLSIKDSVRLSTNGAFSGTYTATTGPKGRGQFTAVTNSIDGTTVLTGDRILVKDHANSAAKGIYTVTFAGTGANGVWDRAADFDEDSEVRSNAFMFVEEGTTFKDTAWVLSTDNPIVIGGASGTLLTFTQFAGSGVGVTSVAVATSNGFSGVSSGGINPVITLSTSLPAGVVRSNGSGAFVIGSVDLSGGEVTNTLPVARGGSGAVTLTGVLRGNGIGAFTAASASDITALIGSSAVTNATNSANSAITNDIATATAVYPTWVSSTSGNQPTRVSNTKLSFVPSTGILSATGFAGNGAGITGLVTSNLAGTLFTLGSTAIAANGTTTVVTGLSSVSSTTFVGALSGNATTASSAAILTTARTIAISGGVTGTATSFNGSTNIIIPITAIDAGSLSTGIVPDARIAGSYTGITNLTGSGSVDFAKFLGLATDTVTTPSFTWTGDLTTGFYRPAASQVAVAIGGVQRVLVTAAGMVVAGSVQATSFIGNVTGSAASFTGNLSGDVTGLQSNTAIASTTVTSKVLSGYASAAGTLSASDTILSAFNKLNGNIDLKQSSVSSANYKVGVALTGSINGTNLVYTMPNVPVSSTEMIFVNGVFQQRGAGNDYQITGNTVTFEIGNAPSIGSILLCTYFV